MDIVAVRSAEKLLDVLAGEGQGEGGDEGSGRAGHGRGWKLVQSAHAVFTRLSGVFDCPPV